MLKSSFASLRSWHRCIWSAGLLLILGSVGGCSYIKAAVLLTAPTTEKVPAEFNRLEGSKAVVYVWVPPEIKWDYPYIRLDLSSYVSGYLKENVKDITIIDPTRVESYIEKSGRHEADPVDIGRHFQADMVVHLAVHQFSIRDPGMAHFYRGRIGSSVEVHDLTAEGDAATRFPLKEVEVAYPDDKAVGFSNVRPEQMKQATYEAFAVEVGKKFHVWERPID